MNHRRLKCYEKLLALARRLPKLLARIPRGQRHLADQLSRALSSAILNLAEGNGRTSHKERARFFDISLASISESSSIIDVLEALRVMSRLEAVDFNEELQISYAMIMNLKKC